MVPALKSEIRKVLTIRSTYIITGLAVLFAAGINFYVAAFQTTDPIAADALRTNVIMGTTSGVAIFVAIVALLLVTHEYRHNTIYYTLTAARSRSQVLLAKLAVLTIYALKFTAIVLFVSIGAALIGWKVGGHELTPQTIDWANVLLRCVFYVWALGMFAAIIGFLVRNQVGAIATYFIGVNTVEGLLTLVLKGDAIYLPFTALGNVLLNFDPNVKATVAKAITISCAWLVVGGLAAWAAFVRRDAN